MSKSKVVQLKGPIRACLTSSSAQEFNEVVLDATNRRGKPLRVKVTCTKLANPGGGDPQGVIPLWKRPMAGHSASFRVEEKR